MTKHELRKKDMVITPLIYQGQSPYQIITNPVSSTHLTDEEIANAAKIANAYEFITKSEHGFDTNIGDRGGRLSGGQRQRVSLSLIHI